MPCVHVLTICWCLLNIYTHRIPRKKNSHSLALSCCHWLRADIHIALVIFVFLTTGQPFKMTVVALKHLNFDFNFAKLQTKPNETVNKMRFTSKWSSAQSGWIKFDYTILFVEWMISLHWQYPIFNTHVRFLLMKTALKPAFRNHLKIKHDSLENE